MSTTTTRRTFLRIATLAAAGVATASLRPRYILAGDKQNAEEKPLYCFPLLGDIHYDKMEHHDLDWVRQEKPGDERQMLNYSKVSASLTPQLLANVSDTIRNAPAEVPFVIQVGDLVEGLCGSKDLAGRQFRDAFGIIEAAQFGVPMLMTKGNHDITGPGAPEAFDQILLPWLAQQSKQDLTSSNYIRKQQDDVFIFFDGYKPDLDWLETTLRQNSARHLFFIVHQPVVPYNARANWIVFPDKHDAPQRARLLSLLGQYRAIVLGGHLHKYSLLTRQVATGSFTQLAVCSVLRDANEKTPKDVLTDVSQYDERLLSLEPHFAPKTLDDRRALVLAEKPSIKQFEYADVPGYAMVKVFADRIEADIYISLANPAWKTDVLPSQVPVTGA